MPVRRWITFNVVGLLGFAVQLLALWSLLRLGLALEPAVALAVLVTVSHNFAWHERVTWADRPRHGRLGRWLAFNVTTGLVSIVANVVVTSMLVTTMALPAVAANLVAVSAASVANYLVSEHLTFSDPSALRSSRSPPKKSLDMLRS